MRELLDCLSAMTPKHWALSLAVGILTALAPGYFIEKKISATEEASPAQAPPHTTNPHHGPIHEKISGIHNQVVRLPGAVNPGPMFFDTPSFAKPSPQHYQQLQPSPNLPWGRAAQMRDL